MPELLVVEPVFAERLWGGNTLRQLFGPAVPDGVIGECWSVSGMPGMSGVISTGAPEGYTLRRAWSEGLVTGQPEPADFPLLCKFLDPQDWLSVQVHPNDHQARELEHQPRGKAECWLVVSCQDEADIILGHTAQTTDELRRALADGTILDHLRRIRVAANDFFMVAAGEVHSLGPGLLVYEVQESSDITYRLYDFDRVGLDGHKRALHVERGFSVVTAPHDPSILDTSGPWEQLGENARTRTLVDCPQFRVRQWELLGQEVDLTSADYCALTVLGGWGSLSTDSQRVELGLGTSVIIPRGAGEVRLAGDVVAVTTDPGPELA